MQSTGDVRVTVAPQPAPARKDDRDTDDSGGEIKGSDSQTNNGVTPGQPPVTLHIDSGGTSAASTATAVKEASDKRGGGRLVNPSDIPVLAGLFTGVSTPQLEQPHANAASMEWMMAMLTEIQGKLTDAGATTSKQSILSDSARREAIAKRAAELALNAIHKMAEAAAKASEGQSANWWRAGGELFGALALVVANVALAVLTGGACVPLLFVTGTMLTEACLDTANCCIQQHNKECTDSGDTADLIKDAFGNDEDCSIEGLTGQAVDSWAQNNVTEVTQGTDGLWRDKNNNVVKKDWTSFFTTGKAVMSKDELDDYKMGAALTFQLLLMAAQIGAGNLAASGNGAVVKLGAIIKATELASKVAPRLEKASEVMNIFADATQASASIYQGDIQIKVADLQNSANDDRAEAAFAKSSGQSITQHIKLVLQFLQDLEAALNEAMSGSSEAIQGTAQTQLDQVTIHPHA